MSSRFPSSAFPLFFSTVTHMSAPPGLWRNLMGHLGGGGPGWNETGVPSSGGGSNPSTGPDGINAGQLQPNNRAANMAAGVPYQLVPAYPPFVRLANDPSIVYFVRFRSVIFGGNGVTAGVQAAQTIYFSVPTIIIARTGSAFDASDAGLPVGRTALQTFRTQFYRGGASTDLIDAGGGGQNTNPAVTVLAENLLGTASQPALLPGNGLFFDNGTWLNIACTTLIDNIEAHVSVWTIEEYGPARG